MTDRLPPTRDEGDLDRLLRRWHAERAGEAERARTAVLARRRPPELRAGALPTTPWRPMLALAASLGLLVVGGWFLIPRPAATPRLADAGVRGRMISEDAVEREMLHIDAQVDGPFAEVLIRERFVNRGKNVTDSWYAVSVDETAVLESFRMTRGDQVVQSAVRSTLPADSGPPASGVALEQAIAGLAPDEAVTFEIMYRQAVAGDAGRRSFTLPVEGEMPSSDLSLQLHLDNAGVRFQSLDPQQLRLDPQGSTATVAHLVPSTDLDPSRQIGLSWTVEPLAPQVLVHHGSAGRYLSLAVDAPEVPREIWVVTDAPSDATSADIATAVEEARATITAADRFRVDGPPAQTAGRPDAGRAKLAATLRAALDAPVEDDRGRVVLVLSDGRAIDDDLLEEVADRSASVQVSAVGVGPTIEAEALQSLARAGRGYAVRTDASQDLAGAVRAVVPSLRSPALVDPQISFTGVELYDLEPPTERLPDLFAGERLVVHGKAPESGEVRIDLRGEGPHGAVRRHAVATIPAEPGGSSALPWLWAAARVDRWQREGREDAAAELAMDYGLVGSGMALVGVELSRLALDGDITLVPVPEVEPAPVLARQSSSATSAGLASQPRSSELARLDEGRAVTSAGAPTAGLAIDELARGQALGLPAQRRAVVMSSHRYGLAGETLPSRGIPLVLGFRVQPEQRGRAAYRNATVIEAPGQDALVLLEGAFADEQRVQLIDELLLVRVEAPGSEGLPIADPALFGAYFYQLDGDRLGRELKDLLGDLSLGAPVVMDRRFWDYFAHPADADAPLLRVSLLLEDQTPDTLAACAEAGLDILAVAQRRPHVVGAIHPSRLAELAAVEGVRRMELVEIGREQQSLGSSSSF